MSAAQGVQWVATDGKVSTMASGKKVWAAAAEPLSADAASAIRKEKNWRGNYGAHVVKLTDLQAGATDDEAYNSAEKGIAEAYRQFHFVRGTSETPLAEVGSLAVAEGGALGCKVIACGGKGKAAPRCHVPLGDKVLSDKAALLDAVQGWARYGSAESSVADSVAEFIDMPEADLQEFLATRLFVILGGTSAAGPTLPLLKLGANVLAVARPGKKLADLMEVAKGEDYHGVLLVPKGTKDGAEVLGADVLTQTPEVIDLIRNLRGLNSIHTQRVTDYVLGSYIYLDGEAHVRASLACDVISQAAVKALKKVQLAYIGSPSVVHAISKEAHADSQKRYDGADLLSKLSPMRLLKFQVNARPPVKNAKGDVYITNGLVNFQGPNYALAKTFQSWRIMLCRRDGVVASATVAPPMYTDSVCHVPAAYAALNGFQGHPPMAAFEPSTVSHLLTAVLVWDLTSPKSTASPSVPLNSPTEFFVQNGFHGGSWRCAYEQESMGMSAFLLGRCWYTSKPKLPPTA